MTQPKRMRPNITAGYGISTDDVGLVDWAWVDDELAKSLNYWVCSTRPDGRPHAVPVWGAWIDGALYFGSDPHAVKARNIDANPNVSVHLESGDEVVILEGKAALFRGGERSFYERFAADVTRKYPMFPQTADDVQKNPMYRFVPSMALAWHESSYPKTATKFVFE